MRLGSGRHSEWNSFRDVISEVTDPVAERTVERVDTITKKLNTSIGTVSIGLTGLREEHGKTGRTLDRLEKAYAADAKDVLKGIDAVGRAQQDQHAWAEQAQYELHAHIEASHADLRGRVDHIQRVLADARPGEPELEQLRRMVGAGLELAEEVRRDLQSVVARAEAVEARSIALVRLTRTVAVIALVITVVAVAIAVLR